MQDKRILGNHTRENTLHKPDELFIIVHLVKFIAKLFFGSALCPP